MSLKAIKKGKQSRPRRCMLYGVHGIGKSTFCSQADAPIFIQTEDGLGDISCDRFDVSQNFEDVIGNLKVLYVDKNAYKTIVIDSLDWLERLIWEEVSKENQVSSIDEIGYGKGYLFSQIHWQKFIKALTRLRDDRGFTVVMTAHCKIERFEDPQNESYDRYTPKLHKISSAIIQEWSDEVLFCAYKVHTKSQDSGFNKERIQGIGSGTRVVYTEERPGHLAKNRLAMPPEIPMNYGQYSKFFKKEEK